MKIEMFDRDEWIKASFENGQVWIGQITCISAEMLFLTNVVKDATFYSASGKKILKYELLAKKLVLILDTNKLLSIQSIDDDFGDYLKESFK